MTGGEGRNILVRPAKERIPKRTIWIFFWMRQKLSILVFDPKQKILISIQCDHSLLFDWERKTKSLSDLFCCLGKGERVRLIEYTKERESGARLFPFPLSILHTAVFCLHGSPPFFFGP